MKHFILVLTLFFSTSIFSTEKSNVRIFIEKNYLNAAFNQLNIENLEKGFHKDFVMDWEDGGELKNLSLKKWTEAIKKQKAEGKDRWYGYKIKNIDVSPDKSSAMIKIHLIKNKKLAYIDYLFLKKRNGQWKVVHKYFSKGS